MFKKQHRQTNISLPLKAFSNRLYYFKAFALFLLLNILITGIVPAVAAPNAEEKGQAVSAAVGAAINVNNPRQYQFYNQTGHAVSGSILRFYRATGGIARHGYPISELLLLKDRYLQYFERSVMLFNPMYANTDQEVTLLPLGKLEAQQYEFSPVTPFEGTTERWYFPETGFSLSGAFLNFWRNNGDNAALGLPVSEPYLENQPDGTKLEVQYFEFAKLEFHTEAKPDQNVQLALVGEKKAQADLKPDQLAPLLAPKGNESPTLRVPSLMFHYVREVDRKKDLLGYNLSVTPANFSKFLDWIKDNGFNTVTVEQILDHLKYGVELPEKAINLRFDDGHVDMWPAYQELKKRGMTATFYVVSRRLELLPEQWRQIDQDGFEVAAHTRTHPDLRGVRDLGDEITGSKLDLEAMLGHPVRTFAYPYGKYGPAITKVTQDSGFELAVTTDGGYNWVAGNMLKQPAISVTGNDSLTDFASKILNGMPKGTALPPLPKPAK